MGRLAKIVGGVFVALILFLLFWYVPPHVQIRGVRPLLPTADQLRELHDVRDGPVSVRWVNTSSQSGPDGVLGHTVFLVEWRDGRVFMVDAGMDRAAAEDFGELIQLMREADDPEIYGPISQLIGSDVEKVTGVGFTHLHTDHTQGIEPFCAARGAGARVFQTRAQATLHNFNTSASQELIDASCLEPGTLEGEVVLTPSGFPGFGMVSLGGHTPGSTLFAIATPDHLWLLSGDITNNKADILNDRPKEWIYSYFIVPEDTERTEALRQWLAQLDAEPDMTVVVSHDVVQVEASGIPQYSPAQ